MENTFSFKLLHQDKKTKARIGEINTPHGIIKTPCFVPVGTQATVKSLTPDDLKSINTEIFFVNTYHTYLRPGLDVIDKFNGLHKFMNWDKPIITDSGGFQVFSLGRKKFNNNHIRHAELVSASYNKTLKQVQGDKDSSNNAQPILVKISDNGVIFQSHWDGTVHEFTPEKSMQYQWELGSDIHIAFDDCTPFPVTHEIASKSLDRTHGWAVRSLKEHRLVHSSRQKGGQAKFKVQSKISTSNIEHRTFNYQALYGVVQGSVFEDLRKKSADFISKMDFDGIAIGGVSVGESKKEMQDVCDWVIPRLPNDKPRHLLGVGEIDDIFDIIEKGIDTFDCVQPTRHARMGHLFVNHKYQASSTNKIPITNFQIDITKQIFSEDVDPIDKSCSCYTCQNFSRAYLHHLFKVRELLAYRLAAIHNLYFINNLIKEIRINIQNNNFLQFKHNFLKIH